MRPGFYLKQSAELLRTLHKIWTEDKIFIADLTSGFWKLSLQCLNRYLYWVKEILVSLQLKLKEISEPQSTVISPSAQNGAIPPQTSTVAQENALILIVAAILLDISALEEILNLFFNESVSERLPLGFPDLPILKGEEQFLKIIKELNGSVMSEFQKQTSTLIVKRCCVALDQVSVVVQRTGFSSNVPTAASAYVSKILTPASEIFAQVDSRHAQLKNSTSAGAKIVLKNWKLIVCEGVLSRYYGIAAQQLEDVAKVDKYSRSRKKAVAVAVDGAMSAFEKIKLQMKMDVGQFKREMDSLFAAGINNDGNDGNGEKKETAAVVVVEGLEALYALVL
ncbi:hypothetical protein HK100_001438 [Physocladia obscura]|uniref:COG complex component COG2 C-terminal domain-containing protein n=1 Tax=Physocladia obscura TaxID=109957 RepID=A0AAD5T8Z6_9FUNG|nr:hypothetical protein HK100_001438 [Physocladia obscura]